MLCFLVPLPVRSPTSIATPLHRGDPDFGTRFLAAVAWIDGVRTAFLLRLPCPEDRAIREAQLARNTDAETDRSWVSLVVPAGLHHGTTLVRYFPTHT